MREKFLIKLNAGLATTKGFCFVELERLERSSNSRPVVSRRKLTTSPSNSSPLGELNAANGTLRHHIDVLNNQRSLTIVRVYGRVCYYAGAPSQMKVLRSMGIDDDERAASLMPVGLSEAQKLVINELKTKSPPRSQAELGRRIGRTRATVHSAVKVLKDRGLILREKLQLAPHLEEFFKLEKNKKARSIDYEWNDERSRTLVA